MAGVGLTPSVIALDPRHGRAFVAATIPNTNSLDERHTPDEARGGVAAVAAAGLLLGPSTLSVLAARTGGVTRAIPIGVGPATVAVDVRTGTAVTLNIGGTLRVRDGLAWVPLGVRRLAPMVLRPARATTLPASVSIVDPSR